MDIKLTLRLCRGMKCQDLGRHWNLHVNGIPTYTIVAATPKKALDCVRRELLP